MNTRIVRVLITLLCGVIASVQTARAAIVLVTNTNDSGPGSLRQALAVANDGDTIDATGISGTILLTSGELQITHSVTINGSGAGNLSVDANMTSRVFENFASDVTICGFSIRNGFAQDSGGGINSSGDGALTVANSIISGNVVGTPSLGGIGGGGLYYAGGGTLIVTNSIIKDNQTAYRGGGIGVGDGGTVTITNSTISDNVALNYKVGFTSGGGIESGYAQLTVMNTTISGNSAGYGGGISAGRLTLINSTISGNVARLIGSSGGGGIYNEGGSVAVSDSTLTGNAADSHRGAGIYNSGGTAQIGNTILNADAPGATISNVGGTITSLGYNLASDNGGNVLTGPGDRIYTDPMLGPLQDNGGPTFTHALLPGSPAINAGEPTFTPPPFYDQRGPGFNRVVNGRIDIGSFEVQAGSTPTPTATLTPSPTATATATPTATAIPRPSPTVRPRPTPTPRS